MKELLTARLDHIHRNTAMGGNLLTPAKGRPFASGRLLPER
jgi:hypothetical protein